MSFPSIENEPNELGNIFLENIKLLRSEAPSIFNPPTNALAYYSKDETYTDHFYPTIGTRYPYIHFIRYGKNGEDIDMPLRESQLGISDEGHFTLPEFDQLPVNLKLKDLRSAELFGTIKILPQMTIIQIDLNPSNATTHKIFRVSIEQTINQLPKVTFRCLSRNIQEDDIYDLYELAEELVAHYTSAREYDLIDVTRRSSTN